MSTDPKTAEERIARAIELDTKTAADALRVCDGRDFLSMGIYGAVMDVVYPALELLPALANDAKQAREEVAILRARCAGCGAAIDPDTCGCGDSRSAGHEGHFFVPMGCDCYRAEPSTLQLLRRERAQSATKDAELATLKTKLEAADSRDNRWIRERNEARADLANMRSERDAAIARAEKAEADLKAALQP